MIPETGKLLLEGRGAYSPLNVIGASRRSDYLSL